MKIITGPSSGRFFALLLLMFISAPLAQAGCPTDKDAMVSDRPTVANASSVVPLGSLQSENGVSMSRGQGMTVYDLPESRARLGVAECTEVLVDLPDYSRTIQGNGVEGMTSVAPALKHQFDGVMEGLTFSGTVGSVLNTGDKRLSGAGPAPFVQLPWSYDLGQGWSVNGMYGLTFHPRGPDTNASQQTSFYMDKTVGDKADIFAEYINDYQMGSAALNRLDFGGSYRYLPTRQIDIKIGVGLNQASPDWYATVGYSFRMDPLF